MEVGGNGDAAYVDNGLVRVEYDLDSGTYRAVDTRSGEVAVEGASSRVDAWSAADGDVKRAWTARDVQDRLGAGKVLSVTVTGEDRPDLLFEATLYEGLPFVVLGAGIENGTGDPVVVHELAPLVGGRGFPGLGEPADVAVLNSASGAVEAFVTRGHDRESENGLLATFTGGGSRRSLFWGGLTYRDFAKYASLGDVAALDGPRESEIRDRAPEGYGLIGYLRAWTGRWLDVSRGRMIRRASGQPYLFPGAVEVAAPWYAATALGTEPIDIYLMNLREGRSYRIGLSWWDYDGQGREQSVVAVIPGKEVTLLEPRRLPDYADRGEMPEEVHLSLPAEVLTARWVRVLVKGRPGAADAVVSEFWVYESEAAQESLEPEIRTIPGNPHPGRERGLGRIGLHGADPHGKRVEPGARYGLDERFYLGFAEPDPFRAAEDYGKAVRAAMDARPNIYRFPTVCGWYASGSHPGCEYVNHTRGMVEEAEWAAKTGFTRYGPVAVRVVPDKADQESEQGWWDDERWRLHGHYVEPYETTEKYGSAVAAQGCLPFTYVHTCLPNPDFLGAHPQWSLGFDPADPVYRNTGYDFTHPGFQAHVLGVWNRLREGGIVGVMFDYPGSGWVEGGFHDTGTTTGAAYRRIFELCREGLGPEAYIHERLIGQYGQPQTDITVGIVDSQRTEWDTQMATPEMYTKCGLRWYKNRVLFTYDMDAKNFLHVTPANRDGLRQMLTMAYLVAPRLLLGTSFRTMTPEQVYDLSRIYPIHDAPQSARPIDLLSGRPFAQVYDFAVGPDWHQLAFYNPDPMREALVGADLGTDPASGGIGLDPTRRYYAYDFWNSRYLGAFDGDGRIEQTLRPGEVRMMSVHAVREVPQFISTNRHVMQGYVDMPTRPAWDPESMTLSGASDVVGGEAYEVTIAVNGHRPARCEADGAECSMTLTDEASGLAVLRIECGESGTVPWRVRFSR